MGQTDKYHIKDMTMGKSYKIVFSFAYCTHDANLYQCTYMNIETPTSFTKVSIILDSHIKISGWALQLQTSELTKKNVWHNY